MARRAHRSRAYNHSLIYLPPAWDIPVFMSGGSLVRANVVQSDVELPTSEPVKTLAEGVEVEIVQDGEGWLVKPGDIKVLGIKNVSGHSTSSKRMSSIVTNSARLRTDGFSTSTVSSPRKRQGARNFKLSIVVVYPDESVLRRIHASCTLCPDAKSDKRYNTTTIRMRSNNRILRARFACSLLPYSNPVRSARPGCGDRSASGWAPRRQSTCPRRLAWLWDRLLVVPQSRCGRRIASKQSALGRHRSCPQTRSRESG